MSLVSFTTKRKHLKNGFLLFSGLEKEISGMKWVKPAHKYTLCISTQDFSVLDSIVEMMQVI